MVTRFYRMSPNIIATNATFAIKKTFFMTAFLKETLLYQTQKSSNVQKLF